MSKYEYMIHYFLSFYFIYLLLYTDHLQIEIIINAKEQK